MPNVNPSPTGSRSNTPVHNQGGRRKQRMEDKVIEIETHYIFGAVSCRLHGKLVTGLLVTCCVA